MKEFLQILCSNESKYEKERVLLEVYNGISMHYISGAAGNTGRKQECAEVLDGHIIRGLCDSMNDILFSIGVPQEVVQQCPADNDMFGNLDKESPFVKGVEAFVENKKGTCSFNDEFGESEVKNMVHNMCRLACLR